MKDEAKQANQEKARKYGRTETLHGGSPSRRGIKLEE
jgi:hypothetical protein